MEDNGLFVSKEIADSIDESQFFDQKTEKEDPEKEPLITICFSCNETTITGICERYNIRSLGDLNDFEYQFRVLVKTSDVIDFAKNMASFDNASIFVGNTKILELILKNKDIIKMGIEQDLINPGSMIAITYL
jgi:hypothetical protein